MLNKEERKRNDKVFIFYFLFLRETRKEKVRTNYDYEEGFIYFFNEIYVETSL